MEEYGLVGFPLGHSFSANFFAEKFAKEGINAVYNNFEMPCVDGLRDFVARHPHLRGFNVTIPHKQAVISQLDTLSPTAEAIGAVNVVVVQRSAKGNFRLVGNNSDMVGFTESLRPLLSAHHQHALVLGTGGASKAVVYGLHTIGISSTYVTRKRHSATINVGELSIPVLEYGEITDETLQQFKVVINCSPVGMYPHIAESPDLPYEALTSEHLLYDLVYNPLKTRFLAEGDLRGATTKNGLEMLHLQAIAAWKMWQTKA